MTKRNKPVPDEFGYWRAEKPLRDSGVPGVNDDERELAFSVGLLRKSRRVSAPSTSSACHCRRSFHLFCTDLFDEKEAANDVTEVHPAPHIRDRDSTRRLPMLQRKCTYSMVEETPEDKSRAGEPDRWLLTNAMTHTVGRKSRCTSAKRPTRPSSSSQPPALDHSFDRPASSARMKSPSPSRQSKQRPVPLPQLQIRAVSLTDQYHSGSNNAPPRTPPSTPKTPPDEASVLTPYSIAPGALRVMSLTPRARKIHAPPKEPVPLASTSKIPQYEDYVREYLSPVERNREMDENDINQASLPTTDQQLSGCPRSLSRAGTALSVRLLSHIANRYLNIQKEYSAATDALNTTGEHTRRAFRPSKRLRTFVNENPDTSSSVSKAVSTPQLKSVFGFSKTASSMHFGYAADRLGLQGSPSGPKDLQLRQFERWPRPQSRRTPIERKHEVTTLRLVTLPLVTS